MVHDNFFSSAYDSFGMWTRKFAAHLIQKSTAWLRFTVIEYQSPEYHYPARKLYGGQVILFGCKSAIFDEANRQIIVDSAERIAVLFEKNSVLPLIGWLADIKIKGDKLVLVLYPNCSYAICINNDFYKLPLL